MAGPTGVYVEGLNATKDNFNKLAYDAEREIGREALKTLGWALAKPMKAATYSTFTRRTGAIQQLLGVHVRQEPQGDKLTGYVEEFAAPIVGTSTSPFVTMIRRRRNATGKRSVSARPSTAFYWRFLEFGTGPRHTARTPKFLRTGKIASTDKGRERQLKRAMSWQASPSRGGIRSRKWLRPIFGSNAPDAIQSFRAAFLKLVDAATSAMPKK
jgi:HK97 gp10 family phage protein